MFVTIYTRWSQFQLHHKVQMLHKQGWYYWFSQAILMRRFNFQFCRHIIVLYYMIDITLFSVTL